MHFKPGTKYRKLTVVSQYIRTRDSGHFYSLVQFRAVCFSLKCCSRKAATAEKHFKYLAYGTSHWETQLVIWQLNKKEIKSIHDSLKGGAKEGFVFQCFGENPSIAYMLPQKFSTLF